jgi:hypothetical protein
LLNYFFFILEFIFEKEIESLVLLLPELFCL